MRIAVATVLIVHCWVASARATGPLRGMLEVELGPRKIEGTPLAWDSRMVYLLGRDGRLWGLDPDAVGDSRLTADRFRSYSVSELRAALLRELGREYEVSGTSHYLVAHRRGQRDQWARRFEELYRSFVHYFSVRGLRPSEPPFPLLGVVCRDRREFQIYAARQGLTAGAGVLGFYAPHSNRIILYDMDLPEGSANWRQNAAVIIHEATHQTAFNTGVHSRYTPPPLWVAEGLATMFEAPGVHDSRHHTRQSDRINRARLHDFRRLVTPRHTPEMLRRLIASDGPFESDPAGSYSQAWALSFYLVETQPRNWAKYLASTAARPPFVRYTSAQRTADFTAVFGDNWQMLQARFSRFLAALK